jgi:DNA-binding CsgD family transcriptional regulator
VPPIFAHVLPLTGSDFRTWLQPSAVAAVLLVRRRTHRMVTDAVAAAFGLTRAETRLLANLFSGRTLTETAATLDITRSTTKPHLDTLGRADASVDRVDLRDGIGPVRKFISVE